MSTNEQFKKVFETSKVLDASTVEQIQTELFKKFLSHTGSVVYLGRKIDIASGVFPPRPDSVVLAQSMDIPPGGRVLDVGTGSGVLSIIAGYRLGWDNGANSGQIVATDVSEAARKCASANMTRTFPHLRAGMFTSEVVKSVFPKQETRFDVILANLPFRNKSESEFQSDANWREVQRTMWDMDYTAHNDLLMEGHKWLEANGSLFLTVPNYRDAKECLALIYHRGSPWNCSVVGLREWSPEPDVTSGFSIAVACLRLTPR